MNNLKYCQFKGTRANINPRVDNSGIILICKTLELITLFKVDAPSPVFVIIHKEKMYFGICNNFKFTLFDDFTHLHLKFNEMQPSIFEFRLLNDLEPDYYLLDYNETMKGDLDEFSDNELSILKKWNREINLKKLLDTEIKAVPLYYKIRNNVKKR